MMFLSPNPTPDHPLLFMISEQTYSTVTLLARFLG